MKQYQIRFCNSEDFNNRLSEIKKSCDNLAHKDVTFCITWSEYSDKELDGVISQIEKQFPKALYYGNQSSGNISEGEFDNGINVTCYVFEGNTTKTELVWVEEDTKLSCLDDLWRYCRKKKDLCAVELIPSLSYLETLQVEQNVPNLDSSILIFGGASVSNDLSPQGAEVIASGHKRTKNGMAVVLYFGKDLQFSSTYVLGWKGLGSFMEVTSSYGKRIKEIDGNPAYSIYEKYLNLSVDDNDTLVFPLIVEDDGIEFIRTPQIINPDKSMHMLVPISTGTRVRIAYGDKNTILNSLYEKAADIATFKPEAIKAFSCAGRKLFWGDAEISKETRILEDVAPVCGFYTGGEILQFNGKLRVLNQTLCIISFKESSGTESSSPVVMKDKSPDKSLVSRLAYFIEKVTEEQQFSHQQLRENMNIIGCLASEYLALYYVNLREKTFRIYSVDEGRLADTKQLLTESNDAFALIRKFANSPAVHPDDRSQFTTLTKDSVIERLNGSKKFSIRFRRNYGDGYLWSVMDVVKNEAPFEEANAIAIGFAERDKEIRREQDQQKQLEAAFQAAEVANRAKTTFLFSMSHDIRTPMNAILGFTDIAIKHADDGAKTMDCLQKIKSSGKHLLELINDILEMSRIESGKLELTRDSMDIREAVANTVHMSQALAVPKSIDLQFRIGDIKNPFVYADELHFNEILINIISNAMKYSHEGGAVKYEVDQIGDVVDGKARYRFMVADKGIGMSEDFLGHIFESFSRENSATVSKLEGAGLGLSIVKRIVDLAGGTIDIQSKVGEGTTVVVELPFPVMDEDAIKAFQKIEDTSEEVEYDLSLGGKRVLLVEDNQLNREITEVILSEAGLTIETAEDGAFAVKMFSDKGPGYYDFILMDIQMPVMNGYEATKAIRKLPGGRDLPIIAVSANAFEEDRQKSLEAGMDDHIAKPIDVGNLLESMKLLM